MSEVRSKQPFFGWKIKIGFVLLILLIIAFFILTRHFALTPRSFVVVPKERISVNDTLVDIRNWGAIDLISHQDTVKALILTCCSNLGVTPL